MTDRVATYVCEERWEDLLDLITKYERTQNGRVLICELDQLLADGREFVERENERAREDGNHSY